MSNMFTSAEAFSQNLDKWDTSNVTTMYRMFEEAKTFNGNISSWKTENVTNMEHMFEKALLSIKTYHHEMLRMFRKWKICLVVPRNLINHYLS